jgi:chromosome segregation ATPase
MTDDEFQRLKEAEKEHLREKKQLRTQLAALKRRSQAQGLVQRMRQGAERLLRETESLVDTLRAQVASNEARLEGAAEADDRADDLHEADEALREERAESLVRQYKAASGAVTSSSRREDEADPGSSDAGSPQEGPDKTIGRMRTPRSDDASDEHDN